MIKQKEMKFLILKHEFLLFTEEYSELEKEILSALCKSDGSIELEIDKTNNHSFILIFNTLIRFFKNKNISNYINVKKSIKNRICINTTDKADSNFYTCYKLLGVI